MQLFQDVVRPTQCSGVAAFGESSSTGKTVLGRNLDWDALPQNTLSKIHAVTTTKNGEKSIVMVHLLGFLTPITGFNDNKVFGAFLDAETEPPTPPISAQNAPMAWTSAMPWKTCPPYKKW